MTEAEFYERFDRHLARVDAHINVANQHLARGEELMAGNREAMDAVREEMRLSRETYSDLRDFSRGLTRRSEVVLQGMIGEISDLRDQTRANTDAVLRVLDRLDSQE